jgi:hypothetical protein
MKTLELLKDYASTTDNTWLKYKLIELEFEISDQVHNAKINTIKEFSKELQK